jgi:hypothetical protein
LYNKEDFVVGEKCIKNFIGGTFWKSAIYGKGVEIRGQNYDRTV